MPEVGPPGSAVLFIGDSMVSRAGFRCDPPWRLSTRAVPGLTIQRWVGVGLSWVMEWLEGLEFSDRAGAQIILWLGGNDVYPRGASFDVPTALDTVARLNEVVNKIKELGVGVTVLGTAPRPSHDRGRVWESTPAFWLERALCELGRTTGADFIPLGRRLCRRDGRRRKYHLVPDFFARDEVHLSHQGYQRLVPWLPVWLGLGKV